MRVKMVEVIKEEWVYSWVRGYSYKKITRSMVPIPERPEDPIDEVIQETAAWWEDNDLYISGDRRDE